MKSTNKITPDDIKKVASMSNSDIEKKLKSIFAGSGNAAVKKMMSNIDVDGLKKQLQTKSSAEISKLVGNIEKLDSGIINKIKDALK